jgi:hypothetical protein
MKRNTIIAFVAGIVIGLFVTGIFSNLSFDFVIHQNGEIHDPEGLISNFYDKTGNKYYYGYIKSGRGFLKRNQYTMFVNKTMFKDKDKVCFGGTTTEKLIFTDDDGNKKEIDVEVISSLTTREDCPHH